MSSNKASGLGFAEGIGIGAGAVGLIWLVTKALRTTTTAAPQGLAQTFVNAPQLPAAPTVAGRESISFGNDAPTANGVAQFR